MIHDSTTTKQRFNNTQFFNRLPRDKPILFPLAMRSKRRFSDDDEEIEQDNNKMRFHQPLHQQQQQQDIQNKNELDNYPKYHHPNGGYIQFTPQGQLRTYKNSNNIEITELLKQKDEKFDLSKIDHGIDGYKLNRDASVESYIINGYENQDYMSYDCDSDLDDDDDTVMT